MVRFDADNVIQVFQFHKIPDILLSTLHVSADAYNAVELGHEIEVRLNAFGPNVRLASVTAKNTAGGVYSVNIDSP